jgi:hypothetical protein
MPPSLTVLFILQGLSVLASLLVGALFSAALSAALLVGLIVGNDGVRKFVIALSALSLLWSAVLLLGVAGMHAGSTLLAVMLIGIAIQVFTIWTLTRSNVRDWMFRKNFHLDETPGA